MKSPGLYYAQGREREFGIHLYQMMTATYRALFRNSNPLAFDWRLDENFALLGHDVELRKLFQSIKVKVDEFRARTENDSLTLLNSDGLINILSPPTELAAVSSIE